VVVDDRERVAEIWDLLQAAEDVEVSRARLTTGDFEVADTFCFERKTVDDFFTSLVDGRLFAQAERLRNGAGRPVFLVEGPNVVLKERKVSRECLQGALVTLMLLFDLPLFRTFDQKETARVLLYTGRQLVRRVTERNVRLAGRAPRRLRGKQLRVLQSLPGVGPDRALALLERFGSVRSVMTAEKKEWLEVSGIGKRTARGMEQVLATECKANPEIP